MAVVNTKSASITNRDATPAVANNSFLSGGALRGAVGVVESVSGDDIGSTYRMFQVPSNARMHDIRLYCSDIGTTTIADIGIYKCTADGGAVVDADYFGSAVSLKDGAVNGTDVLLERLSTDPGDLEKPLWQGLGLSADPCLMYDVVLTLTAASDAAGSIALKGTYAI